MTVNREELAWAAGLFDGEGSVHIHPMPKQGTGPTIYLQVGQKDRRVLDRFHAAVKVGAIEGPHRDKRRPEDPGMFKYSAGGHEDVHAVGAMLWAFLSPVKRLQWKTKIEEWRAYPGRRYKQRKTRRVVARPWNEGV